MPRMLYVDGGSSGLGRERTRLLRRGRALSHVGLNGQRLLSTTKVITTPAPAIFGHVVPQTTALGAVGIVAQVVFVTVLHAV